MLLPWLLGWEQPADRTTFAAALHAGSCAGICWALRGELRALERRELALLAASTVPAAVAGLLAADVVEERLGRPPQLAALLAGAGVLMWWVDRRAEAGAGRPPEILRGFPSDAPGEPDGEHRMITAAHAEGAEGAGARRHGVGPRETAYAALAQVVALVPGVSRSGATLTALRAAGVPRAEAERFSLLMSLPVTAGAAGLTLLRADRSAARAAGPGVLTAALAGATTATLAQRRAGRPLAAAALYRLGLAALVARQMSRKGAQ